MVVMMVGESSSVSFIFHELFNLAWPRASVKGSRRIPANCAVRPRNVSTCLSLSARAIRHASLVTEGVAECLPEQRCSA